MPFSHRAVDSPATNLLKRKKKATRAEGADSGAERSALWLLLLCQTCCCCCCVVLSPRNIFCHLLLERQSSYLSVNTNAVLLIRRVSTLPSVLVVVKPTTPGCPRHHRISFVSLPTLFDASCLDSDCRIHSVQPSWSWWCCADAELTSVVDVVLNRDSDRV